MLILGIGHEFAHRHPARFMLEARRLTECPTVMPDVKLEIVLVASSQQQSQTMIKRFGDD